jgi:hypothetical protein
MRKSDAAFVVIALLASGHALAGGDEIASVQRTSRQQNIPSVEVSSVTVEPAEIRASVQRGEEPPTATVTVQLFHQLLTSEQSVVLQVATLRTDPPGISVTYSPEQQTIRLPPSDPGRVVATLKVSKPSLGSHSHGTVDITATLSDATRGIRIENNNPSDPAHWTKLTVRQE